MTDEEKKYRNCVIDETITCEDFSCENCPVKDAYNYGKSDGFAEGRKEVREHETTCVNRLHHIEKVNEQLQYNLKCRDDELAESKAEIKQIIERERVVPEHYLVEMIDKNKELKAQIESLLKYAKNKGIIKSWFYNGSYSWEKTK